MSNFEKEHVILMMDGCTPSEAQKAIDKGVYIFENPEEWIQSLKDCNCYEGETIEKARNHEYSGVSMVVYEGHEYLIEYVL